MQAIVETNDSKLTQGIQAEVIVLRLLKGELKVETYTLSEWMDAGEDNSFSRYERYQQKAIYVAYYPNGEPTLSPSFVEKFPNCVSMYDALNPEPTTEVSLSVETPVITEAPAVVEMVVTPETEEETKKLAQFVRDCYNLSSVTLNTPERKFLASMCCDTDNMGLGMDLNTFYYADGCETRENLVDAIANTMETYFSIDQENAKEWMEEYNFNDEDDLDDDEWDKLNTWYAHYKTIANINPKNINWQALAEDVWGADMDTWAESLISE